jgi:hypothetical protein
MSERDWIDELVKGGVIALAGFDDANGNPAYKMLGFPPGEEGVRLRALFEKHVRTEIPAHWKDTTAENLEKKFAIIGGGE